jgi:ribosomal protein S18 acetylase RimI-like enzyme
MIETSTVRLRPTLDSDLEFVIALERDPDNRPFIKQWTLDLHADAIRRSDREHWIIESTPVGDRLGYLIAYDLTSDDLGVYIKRVVTAEKSRGVGRAALSLFVKHAFADLSTDYVWLCVYPENERGQRCYRSIGFILFDAPSSELDRHSLFAEGKIPGNTVMMILRQEGLTCA